MWGNLEERTSRWYVHVMSTCMDGVGRRATRVDVLEKRG